MQGSLYEQMSQPIVNDFYCCAKPMFAKQQTVPFTEHPFAVEYMNITEGKNYAKINQYCSRFTDIDLGYEEFVHLLETKNVYKLTQSGQLVAIVACRENGSREVLRISVWYNDMRNLAGVEDASGFVQRYANKYLKFNGIESSL
jgi:hypothetical protein